MNLLLLCGENAAFTGLCRRDIRLVDLLDFVQRLCVQSGRGGGGVMWRKGKRGRGVNAQDQDQQAPGAEIANKLPLAYNVRH